MLNLSATKRATFVMALFVLPLGASEQTPTIELEACRLGEGGLRVPARCGELSVPEDHENPGSRSLQLPVAVLKATSREPQPDPIVLLAGGPGQAATEAFLPMLGSLRRLRRDRDLVMLDQRGTGESSLLTCSAFEDEEAGEDAQADPEVMKALATECVAEIGKSADLRLYATRDAARDLEALRIALGVQKLNLYGVSYGTRLAQVYATMFPDRVRTVILDGVVPLDLAFGPAIGTDAQAAIDTILARCAAAAPCNSRFPDLAARLRSGLAALEQSPAKVRIPHPRTALPEEVTVTREVAAQVLRLMTYSPETSVLLPLMVDSIAKGELDAIAGQWLTVGGSLMETMNQALSLSVICAEDAPFFDPAELETTATSFLRDDVPKALAATCPLWPTRPLPENARAPFAVDVPTLLLSGENDPVTPPHYGERVAAGLKRARHLIAPGMGHNVLPRGCVAKLVTTFVETADATELDASCIDDLVAPEPFLSPAGPAPPPESSPAPATSSESSS